MNEGRKELNQTEQNQLLIEVMLLEQYLVILNKDIGGKVKHIKHKGGSSHFIPHCAKHDPVTLKYLVQTAWGCSKSYLCNLRKKNHQFLSLNGVTDGFEFMLLTALPPVHPDDKELPARSVIDSYDEFSEQRYTADYAIARATRILRSHISKTMGIAFTGFAFKDSMENGGIAIKLGFFWAQSYKIAEQMVHKTVVQPDGSRRQTVQSSVSRTPSILWTAL
jgi:hypothetical protein